MPTVCTFSASQEEAAAKVEAHEEVGLNRDEELAVLQLRDMGLPVDLRTRGILREVGYNLDLAVAILLDHGHPRDSAAEEKARGVPKAPGVPFHSSDRGRDALEGEGPQRRSQKRLGRRLEEVAKAVGGGYCQLQMPLKLALGIRGTVAGHRLGTLPGGGGAPPPSNASLDRVACHTAFQKWV